MSPSRLFLKCLGYPELRGPDGKVVRIRVKKHVALLVYLAVDRRRSHDRGRLVSLLWPRVSAAKGRHSFSVAISFLRTVFGREAFPVHRAGIRFLPSHLVLDVDRLEAGRVLGGEGEDDLEVDGFLRGFDIDDAPEFGLWKEREHARRLPAIHAGLLTLIDHGRRRGSHDEIMQRAERLLALDHLAEEGIRAKMEALALVGDRFAALRVFEEWKAQLQDELGAEPSLMVDGMASQLRKRGWEPQEPNPAPAVPAEQWRGRPFVGRKAEFRKLYEVWEAVKQHRPQQFLISGDSGVGKTTLAQRLVTAAGLEGASVSRVQCYQMEQRIPFGTIGGLVAGLLGRPGVAATSPESLAELSRIVPQVKHHFPNLPAPKMAEGESARLLFAEGVIDLLQAVMEERPVLLVIDDLHYADEASLAVLHLCLRRITEGRMLVVLCLTISRESSLHQRAFGESAGGPPQGMTLSPMTAAEAEEMLGSMISVGDEAPSRSELRAIARASGGFPAVVELLARDWLANGSNGIALGLRAITANLPDRQTHETTKYEILTSRALTELSHNALQVLNLAAVLGERSNELEHYCLLDLSVAQTLDGMRELVSRRLFRDVGNGVEFINEMVRDQVYRCIPAPHRVVIHDRIAQNLLATPRTKVTTSTKPTNDLETAWHLARAHRIDESTEYLFAGCRKALLDGAPDSVVLSIQSSLAELEEGRHPEARELQVLALHELGRWKEALAISAELEDGQIGLRILALEARWQMEIMPPTGQRAVVHELIGIASTAPAYAARAIGLAAFMAGRLRDDDMMSLVLQNLPTSVGSDTKALAEIKMAAAQIAFYYRRLDEGEEAVTTANRILTKLGAADRSLVSSLIGIAVFRMARGDYRDAIRQLERARAFAERLDNGRLRAGATSNLALARCRIGDYEGAIVAATGVDTDADIIMREVATYAKCCALALLNKHEAAGRAIDEGEVNVRAESPQWIRQLWSFHKADTHWLCNRRAPALRAAQAGLTAKDHMPDTRANRGPWARWATLVWSRDEKRRVQVTSVLMELVCERDGLDWLDRYEVVAASLRFGLFDGSVFEAFQTECFELWSKLEPGTREFLLRFDYSPDKAIEGRWTGPGVVRARSTDLMRP